MTDILNPNRVATPNKHYVAPNLTAISAIGEISINPDHDPENLPPVQETQFEPKQPTPVEAEAPKQ